MEDRTPRALVSRPPWPTAFLVVLALVPVPRPASAAELLMFEQKACPFCESFNREIAPDYPRSKAGAIAPLRHVDIYDSRTGGIEGLEPAVFTPTFVLVEGTREIGRLLGYPGRRFFYPEIQVLIDRLEEARASAPVDPAIPPAPPAAFAGEEGAGEEGAGGEGAGEEGG